MDQEDSEDVDEAGVVKLREVTLVTLLRGRGSWVSCWLRLDQTWIGRRETNFILSYWESTRLLQWKKEKEGY